MKKNFSSLNIFKNKSYFILFLVLLILLILGLLYKFVTVNNDIVKCNMKYALCPAAKCVPDPNDNSKAYCFCDVKNGTNYSFGNNNCKNIQPYINESGSEMIYSDFSPIIKNMGYHGVTCPSEAVNLNCMNKICSVYPHDPSKAICVCDKTNNQGQNWVTYNKNNTEKICNYQSGASLEQQARLQKFIKENP